MRIYWMHEFGDPVSDAFEHLWALQRKELLQCNLPKNVSSNVKCDSSVLNVRYRDWRIVAPESHYLECTAGLTRPQLPDTGGPIVHLH